MAYNTADNTYNKPRLDGGVTQYDPDTGEVLASFGSDEEFYEARDQQLLLEAEAELWDKVRHPFRAIAHRIFGDTPHAS